MSKSTDVIVAGSGLAGLMAALAAARQGCGVRVVDYGAGCLAIGGGFVDLLGYDNEGARLDDPWEGMARLAPDHPYSLLGAERVREALDALADMAAARGLRLHTARGEDGRPRNMLVPTIMGTLKPTYLVPEALDPAALTTARRVLVASVQGFRDCRPALVIDQLRRYPGWADRDYVPCVVPTPFDDAHRSLNALDLARAVERPGGRDWLLGALRERAAGCDLALIPPILGRHAGSDLARELRDALGCPIVEMLAIPPGVGGLRLRDALLRELAALNVEFLENAQVVEAETAENRCTALTVLGTGRRQAHRVGACVMATGGILGGGVELMPGSARERVFGIAIDVPGDVAAWSEPAIFGSHLVSRLGVRVDSGLRAVNAQGAPIYENVFFAGRTLGGHDPATEKSGYGVALSTGWQAGLAAARAVRGSDAAGPAGAGATGGKL